MSLHLFPLLLGVTGQDTVVQSPDEVQDSWQCQKPQVPGYGCQRTPAGVNSFRSSAEALPDQFTAKFG